MPRASRISSRVFRELLNLLSPGSGVPTDERRDTIRLYCAINATLKTKKTTRECRVTNASLTGLQLEMESKIRRKTTVSIHRNRYGSPVWGTVIWCRAAKSSNRFQVGVAYKDDREMLRDSWIKPALRDLGFTAGRITEKRQLTRVPGHQRRCFLKSPAGDTYTCGEVQNLSIGGASIDSEVEMPKGLKLVLKIDGTANLSELICQVEVRSCKHSPKTRKYICGLIFLDCDEKLVRKHMSAMMGEC